MGSKLFDELMDDIKTTMKARDNAKLVALRMLHSQIKDVTVNAGKDVTDAEVATVVAKALKQRADSLEQYKTGQRQDLVDREQNEIDWIRKYQPKQLEPAEIEALVRACIAEAGAATKKDMGKVMALLMPQVKGRADGKVVNQIVSSLLPS